MTAHYCRSLKMQKNARKTPLEDISSALICNRSLSALPSTPFHFHSIDHSANPTFMNPYKATPIRQTKWPLSSLSILHCLSSEYLPTPRGGNGLTDRQVEGFRVFGWLALREERRRNWPPLSSSSVLLCLLHSHIRFLPSFFLVAASVFRLLIQPNLSL